MSKKVVDLEGLTDENGTMRMSVCATDEPFCYVKDGKYVGYDRSRRTECLMRSTHSGATPTRAPSQWTGAASPQRTAGLVRMRARWGGDSFDPMSGADDISRAIVDRVARGVTWQYTGMNEVVIVT